MHSCPALTFRKRNRTDFHSEPSIHFSFISSKRLLFYRGGCPIYSLRSASRLLRLWRCGQRADCEVFGDVPACFPQRSPALHATQKAEFPLVPEEPGKCACWSPVGACLLAWSCPGKHGQLLHLRGLSQSGLLLCQVHRVAQDGGLESWESREEAVGAESWVTQLKHQTGSATAEGCERGTVPWSEWNFAAVFFLCCLGHHAMRYKHAFHLQTSRMKWIWIHIWRNWSFPFTL